MVVLGIFGFLGMVFGSIGYVLLESGLGLLFAGVGVIMALTSWAVMNKEAEKNEKKLGIPAWMKEAY